MDDESYNFNNSTRVVRLQPDLRDIAEQPRKIDYAPTEVLENPEPRFLDGAQDHHSIIQFKDARYYFYHIGGQAFKPRGYAGSRRIVCCDPLECKSDGGIKLVEHGTEPAPLEE
jgi:hypothetical protein